MMTMTQQIPLPQGGGRNYEKEPNKILEFKSLLTENSLDRLTRFDLTIERIEELEHSNRNYSICGTDQKMNK